MSHFRKRQLASCLIAVLAGACGESTGPEDAANVTLSFVSAPHTTASAQSSPRMPGILGAPEATGTNGTLSIDELQIVVDEFKLEGDEDACQEAGKPEKCADFEAEAYFLDLPLDAVPVNIASAEVPEGTYFELKLETKDLDSSDDADEGEINSLADQVRASFADWPETASLRIAGSFAPEDGSDPRSFVVYLEAEVKVELTFHTPLTVVAGDESTRVMVEVDPLAWFVLADGTVTDLSEMDFATTGEVVKFEAKMREGFTKIEIED